MPTSPTVPVKTMPAEAAAAGGELGRGALFGRYVLLDAIGEGGMGKVFAAYDASLDRNIALKIVRHAPERLAQAWLMREAKAMARVQHPAIVTVHHVGSVGARVYIAMELVRGTTLRGWLDRAPRSWREIVAMYVAAGRGLEAAHAAGVIHRDFKPENVLVDDAGRVRVSDFGLAELRGGDATSAPASAGTPWYMAPEQYTGRSADARSDQFSFCVALWQAVCGQHPFTEIESELPRLVTAGETRTPPDRVPRWLGDTLRRGLAVDAAARYPTMTELLAALDRGLTRGRRRVALPLALVLAGAALAAPIVLASTREHGPTCEHAGARARSVWGGEQRLQVTRALGSTAPRVLDAIDRYASAWSVQRVAACRATNELGEQSGELLDLRMQCLDRRIDELGALVGVLGTGERGVTSAALDAVASLTPLSVCEDVTALREVVPLPALPVQRARVAAVRTAETVAKADLDTGRFARGLSEIEELLPQADALGYDPLIAELELMHGRLAWRRDRMDVAEAAIYRALERGEAGRDAETTARAWLELVGFISQERKRPDEAKRLGNIAQGAIDRYAGDFLLTSGLAEQLGWIALDQGKLDEAEHHLQRAYDLRRAKLPEDSVVVAASLEHLALLATAKGDHGKALELHRRALATMEKVDGPDHPDTLTELNDYAAALFQAGKLDEALATYRDGLTRVERTLGPDGIDAAMYVHNIGLVDTERGNHDEAIALQRRALAIYVRVSGPDAPDTIAERIDLARALRDAGRRRETIEAYRTALASAMRGLGPDSEQAKDLRRMLAQVEK